VKELIVKKSFEIDAPASKVWEILTNPTYTKQYMFGCELLSDWKIGSPVIWKSFLDGKVYVKGNLLKIESNKFLQFTVFDPNMGVEDIPSNYATVTYDLSSEGNGTKLSISQGDFAGIAEGEKRYNEANFGWDMIFIKMKELAEQKK